MPEGLFEAELRKRGWRFHSVIIVFCLLVAIGYLIFNPKATNLPELVRLFLIVFIQIELFILVARRIFRDVKPGTDRKELTKTVLLNFLVFMILCFIIALIINIILITGSSLTGNKDPETEITLFFLDKFGMWMKQTLGGLLFGAAIFIFVQWQDSLKREQKLREENLIFQNETLRTQVNPHFLFNSLNTLSSLVASHPDVAEKFIIKLSSIYRYIIENSSKDRVSLKDELDFITDYFFLYQIRDQDKISLDVKVDRNEENYILPVSLQILVENAIKHNKATRDEPLKITVQREGKMIIVMNNLQRMASHITSTGIGLKNLGERIRLITGENLIIEENVESFTVKIPLL